MVGKDIDNQVKKKNYESSRVRLTEKNTGLQWNKGNKRFDFIRVCVNVRVEKNLLG